LSQQNQPASLVSVDGFVAEVIPDPEKKHIIFENWIMIREKVLKSFLKEYPVLVFALEQKRISQAEILLKQSRREFEDGKFDHVVTDSAKACEALLNVLYHKNYGEAPFHLEFGDFLYRMKELIETELGSLVYTDLDFIRYWRNLVVHPQEYEITLDKKTAFQVIARSEMFYELFKNVLNPFKKEP
jgi:HEPN domain-containing protein